MLVTNYGFDNALCRVVYNLADTDDVGITLSTRYLQDYLEDSRFYMMKNELIFVGFYRIEDKLYSRVNSNLPTVVISSYKMNFDNNITMNDPNESKTTLLARHLKVDNDDYIKALGQLAFKVTNDQNEISDLYNAFYDAIGHEEFIQRFTNYRNISLTDVEIRIAELALQRKAAIAESIIDNESFLFRDGILVMHAGYGMRNHILKYLENQDKLADLNMVVFWDINDIQIKLQVVGGSVVKQIVENLGGSFWHNKGMVSLPFSADVNNEYVFDIISSEANKVVVEAARSKLEEQMGDTKLAEWLNNNIFNNAG